MGGHTQGPQGSAAAAPAPSGGAAAMRSHPSWSKLPPSEATGTGRKVIAFQLPLSRAALQEHSDEEEEESAVRAAKRLKAAAGGRGAAKSKLMDFLPAPKNEDLSQALGAGAAGRGVAAGSGRGGGGARGGRPPKKGFFDDDDDDDEVDPVLAAGFGDGGAASVGLSNEAFRAEGGGGGGSGGEDEDGGGAGPSSSSAGAAGAAWAQHPAAAYAQHHISGSGSGGSGVGGPSRAAPPLGGGFEMPAELAGVQFKEISGQQLRYVDPARKEAKNGIRSALGADFENELRSQATQHLGSKQARSKHQIGTLFANAKINEIELLEGKARNMKTKRETQAKYGW